MPRNSNLLTSRGIGIGVDTSGRTPVPSGSGAAPSWVFPGATIDMWFSTGQYYGLDPSQLTFSRNSITLAPHSSGFLQQFAAGVPAITSLGLQAWVGLVNLILQSQFAATWTATRTTLTANAVASPTTATTGATLVEDSTATSTHFTVQAVTKAASALTYVYSVYAKAGARTRIMLQLDDAASNGATAGFDLSGGQIAYAGAGIGTPFTSITTQIIAMGATGWYRCQLIAVSNTALTIQANVFLDNGSGTAAQSTSYSGDGASGVSLFGAQLEQSSNFAAGPYIPTTTGSVTKSADNATKAITFGSAYSIVAWGIPHCPATFASSVIIGSIDDGTNNNKFDLEKATSTGLSLGRVLSGGSTTYNQSGGAWATNTLGKIGLAGEASVQTCAFNGTALTAGTGAMAITPTTLRFGVRADAAIFWNGMISRLAYFPTNIGNAVKEFTV